MEFNIDKYTLDELKELLKLPKTGMKKEDVLTNVRSYIKKVQSSINTEENKTKATVFLTKVFEKLCKANNFCITAEDKTKILATIKVSETEKITQNMRTKYASPYDNTVINENIKISDNNKKEINIFMNIDSKFRDDPDSPSTDFTITFPSKLKNVLSIELATAEVINAINIVNDTDLTNEFTIKTYTMDGRIKRDRKTFIIKLLNGDYNMDTLVESLNALFEGHPQLDRVRIKISKGTKKVNFSLNPNFTLPESENPDGTRKPYFDLDFRLSTDTRRDITLNFGYLLGFTQAKYSFASDYENQEDKTNIENKMDGYNSENAFNIISKRYFFIEINDYVNNAPKIFDSVLSDGTTFPSSYIIGKIQNKAAIYETNFVSKDDIQNRKREYFGPVSLDKIAVRLLDENGNVIDLQNKNISLTLDIKMLNDV